jgi:crossover junction endodeoxyribonuclease RuvC
VAEKRNEIAVGIDPGTIATGFAALEGDGSSRPRVLSITTFEFLRSAPRAERLAGLMLALENALLRIRPSVVAVEAGNVHRNARAALAVSEARGIAMAMACRAGAKVIEVQPQSARKALGVARFGQRRLDSKASTMLAVESLLGIRCLSEDEADAAALAWFCLGRRIDS